MDFVKNLENNLEEQKILLLLFKAYSVAVQKKITLPTLSYVDEIAGSLDISRARAKDLADQYTRKYFKPPKFNLDQTASLYLGMYNATMDLGFPLDLDEIKDNVIDKGLVEDGSIKAVKFVMGHGRFKKTFEYTNEYGAKSWNANQTPTYCQFLLKVSEGDKVQGASFNIYATGRIRFSGGYLSGRQTEPMALTRFISRHYQPINPNEVIAVNNNTAEIKLGTSVKVLGLYTVLDVGTAVPPTFKGYKLKAMFEPEKNKFIVKQRKNSPFLYVSFEKEDDSFALVISRNGTVIVEGMKNVAQSIRVAKEFFEALKDLDLLDAPPKTPRNLTVKHKPSKLARRANNRPAPEVTRRGTTCPLARRPNPYSFQGACPQGKSHYVRPNPQGQPCCYKKPKNITYIQNKVENRYNRANVKVPESVRKTFGFGANTNQKGNNVGRSSLNNVEIVYNASIGKNKVNPVGLKIGSRQCSRYSKVALIDIARRKGIKLPQKVTKPILCNLLAEYAAARAASPASRRGSPPASRRGSPAVSNRNNNNFNNLLAFANAL